MSKFKIGDRVTRYLPWKPSLRECVVVDQRVPLEGEFIMNNNGVVFKRHGGFLSATDASREYWIIEEVAL